MHWAAGHVVYALWLLIPLAAILAAAARRRRRLLERFAARPTLAEILEDGDPMRERVRRGLFLAAVAFLILALARPQWGFEWHRARRRALDILILLDSSRSMLTEDVRPNRLERSKLAVLDLLQRLKGDRIGLIAFAGDAFLVCPLTVDVDGFRLTLEDVDTTTVPRGGTNLGAAIDAAIKEYARAPAEYRVVVVLTDGENLEGDPLAAARRAKAKGIKIYCVGIGTPEGELVRVPGPDGRMELLKDSEGNAVKSRLNERLLERISLETGGIYVRASGAQTGLDLIYRRELAGRKRREIQGRMEKKYHERFQFPLALAILLMLGEILWTGKRGKDGHPRV